MLRATKEVRESIAKKVDPSKVYSIHEASELTTVTKRALGNAYHRRTLVGVEEDGEIYFQGKDLAEYVRTKIRFGRKFAKGSLPYHPPRKQSRIKEVCIPIVDYINTNKIRQVILHSDGKIQVSRKPKVEDIRVVIEEG